MKGGPLSLQFECLKLMKAYASGSPVASTKLRLETDSAEAIIGRIAARKKAEKLEREAGTVEITQVPNLPMLSPAPDDAPRSSVSNSLVERKLSPLEDARRYNVIPFA